MVSTKNVREEEIMPGQNGKIHPQKFGLWIAITSITLTFAGFTSAYIVRRGQGLWDSFELPTYFTISTIVIILSSITMQMTLRAARRESSSYNALALATLVLGTAFMILQYLGFHDLYEQGIRIDGNVSGSFLFVIAGAHLAHIIGGLIALLVTYINGKIRKDKKPRIVGLQLVNTYWHFIDILWIYLFIFFVMFC